MQDGTHKGNIDLDELVNTLMRERSGAAASAQKEPAEQPIAVEEPLPVAPTEPKEPVSQPQPQEAEAVDELPVSPADVFVAATEEQGDEEEKEEPPVAEKPSGKPKVKRRLFARRAPEPEENPEEVWADWGLKPIGHYHVKKEPVLEDISDTQEPLPIKPDETDTPEEQVVDMAPALDDDGQPDAEPTLTQAEPQPLAEADEFPPVQAVDETITMPIVIPGKDTLDATRVVELPGAAVAVAEAPAPEVVDDQLPDQLSLEEMVRVEDMEEPPEGVGEDPTQRLQRTRMEKIREFTISGEEEEVNEPEEEVVEEPEEESEIEDFTGYEDTKAVQLELRYRCRTAALSALFTGVLELVLLLLTIITASIGSSPITDMGYLTVQLFGLGLMVILNYTTVSRGLSGLFMLAANSDTGPALASVTALLDVALHFIGAGQQLPMWAPVAGLILLFNACAQYVKAQRVRRNFAFVAYPGEKYSACIIEDEKALHEIGRRAVMEGDATVGYFRRTAFLSEYLSNAYEDDRSDDWARWFVPVAAGLSLALSLLLAVAGYLDGFWNWLQCFVGMMCLTSPAVSLAVQLPLSQSCRHMLSRGGFLVGWKAVRRFGNPDALAVDVADLYPDESMLLHGIKTFSGTHIDDAILDAASLAVRSGGPLAMIFRRIIENKENLLHEVDSLVYEQGMGLSGWVDGRRVLVGNRRLLQNHGVDVPSSDYEARYAKDGRRLVYLSTAGELSAMFVVTYLPDPAIKAALQGLCRARVTLLIRSCDPNVTAEDLCHDFELDEYYVDVLPAVAGRLFVQLTEGKSDSASAELASNGHILGTAQALSSCRSLRIKALIALLTQTALSAIGLALCVVWAAQGSVLLFVGSFGLLVGSALLSWLLPLFKRC